MVSIGGNLYSVPDTARRRVLDVHVFADEIRIFEAGALIASHAAFAVVWNFPLLPSRASLKH
jgi:hypothetical protein